MSGMQGQRQRVMVRMQRVQVWVLRGLALTLLVLFLGGGIAGVQAYRWYVRQPWDQQIAQLMAFRSPEHTKFYGADGKMLLESYSQYQKYLEYEDIPSSLIDAVIAIEDQNYFEHHGIDVWAIVRAGWMNIRSGKIVQGGSTITQQLVRHHLLKRDKTFARKIYEAVLAIKLEQRLSKEKILEFYLNHLFLGSNTYGVGGAARRFFGRHISQLQLHEHALIAGLFQAPSRYNPVKHRRSAVLRQKVVLKAMLNTGKIDKKTHARFVRKRPRVQRSLRWTGVVQGQDFEGYYLDYVAYRAREILGVPHLKDQGYKIYTGFDAETSKILYGAVQNMEQTFQNLERKHEGMTAEGDLFRLEVSAVVLNAKTGVVEAMIGGRDYATSRFNRVFQARRAPGSAFKPVIYSYALSLGYRWSDVFYLAPITLAHTYRPRTPKSQYLQEITLLRAFYDSVNVTTLEVGRKLGINRIIEHARRMGIRSPIHKEYGSLIGQSEVTQMDMLRMYSTFAREGHMIEPAVITKIKDRHGKVVYESPSRDERSQEVLSAQINYLMVRGLSKVLSHGTGRRAYHLADIAGGKTGTTNESVDNWFCGFTQDYVMVVWVGPDLPQALVKGRNEGATLALPIWKDTMSRLSQKVSTGPFIAPEGVESAVIDSRYGHLAADGVEAWFLSHTLPQRRASALKVISLRRKWVRGFGSPLR